MKKVEKLLQSINVQGEEPPKGKIICDKCLKETIRLNTLEPHGNVCDLCYITFKAHAMGILPPTPEEKGDEG